MFGLWRFRRDVVAGHRRDVPRSLSKLKERIGGGGGLTKSAWKNNAIWAAIEEAESICKHMEH